MRYLTVSEAAELLQLSVPTIKRYIYDGKLKSTKLPGGQHRIAESEINRLLSPRQAPPDAAGPDSAPEATSEERLAVLERWATELEAEVERLSAGLSVVSRYCSRTRQGAHQKTDAAESEAEHRVLVLGPGCKRCDALYELTARVLETLGHADIPIGRVKDVDDIAAFGPVLTPALVIDDALALSGRVPAEPALKRLLSRYLG